MVRSLLTATGKTDDNGAVNFVLAHLGEPQRDRGEEGQFDTVPITGLSVPGRVVTVKGAGGMAAEAARVAPPLLAALERYFGRAYPFEKLDLIAVPEFWPGAMENAGAITFADGILLVDPRSASVEQRKLLASVAAHEMAHMWFGNLVTLAWWDDVWLNEAFASWMADKVIARYRPEWASGEDPLSLKRKANWISAAAATLKTWPDVKVVSWFDATDFNLTCNWAVDSSTNSLAAVSTSGKTPLVRLAASRFMKNRRTQPRVMSPVGRPCFTITTPRITTRAKNS